MFVGKLFYKDGSWLEKDDYVASQHATVYEVIRLINGVPLFWDAHFQRLIHSFEILGIALLADKKIWEAVIVALVKKNGLPESNLRINVHYNKTLKTIQSIEIGQVPVVFPEPEWYKIGVNAAILAIERPTPNVKNAWVEIRKVVTDAITEEKVWDVVLKNHLGELTEGGRTNIFFIKNNTVYTPPIKQVLPGITRMMVIKACKNLEIPVYEKTVTEKELSNFEACFFTGTSPGIIPIKKIGQQYFDAKSSIMAVLTTNYQKMMEEDIAAYPYSL